MKIYVATSWKNDRQPAVVTRLREEGHEVYDFRNPAPGVKGFDWADIDPNWRRWTGQQYTKALEHRIACDGFARDMQALRECDACVLVMPCGRSAHLELGFAAGVGKYTFVLMETSNEVRLREEPELMYRMTYGVCLSMAELISMLGYVKPKIAHRDEAVRQREYQARFDDDASDFDVDPEMGAHG